VPERGHSDTTHFATSAAGPLAMASSASCEGLRDLAVDVVVHQSVAPYGYGYYNYGYYPPQRGMPVPASAGRAGQPAPAPVQQGAAPPIATAPTGGPSHYTTTNVHERGVDEADLVKTDGRFVYTVQNNQLVIAKTWPVAKTAIVARVAFKAMSPQQIYLHGDDVIVQGYATEQLAGWTQGRTRVAIVDVRDREAPRVRDTIDVEGGVVSSRVVGDELYLVGTPSVQVPMHVYEAVQKASALIPRADQNTLRPWEVQARLAETLRRVALADLSIADLHAMLPRVRSNGVESRLACADLYIPANATQLMITELARISLRDGATDAVGAMIGGGTVYASRDALYIAAPSYMWNRNGYAEYGTQVHEFALGDERTRPRYVASGKVEGQILNEFSMSEWQGDLRIATTAWSWNGQQGGNDLFVLRPFGRELRTIGALRGLAKGERIYSGRMFGDKGYLVTFRQTDPLFTLDLRDPTRPRVAGELKINGFSSYLHPMGDDLLLAIGQDATDQGRVTGLHLQVFDVSDPAHPTRRFHEKLATGAGSSWSAAQYDHHAFMYDAVTGTLALPVNESTGGSRAFTGLVVYHVDRRDGFELEGRLDHAVVARVKYDHDCTSYCSDTNREAAVNWNPITRSIVVDKYVLSLSNAGLEIHRLGSLKLAAALPWTKIEEITALAR
jgi:uncharacterized secreted protein with C-terminal beta-propeller domain